MFTENEMLSLILKLVTIFAQLQRSNIAHRNIKPANLVFGIKKTAKGKSSPREEQAVIKFEDILVCNFEMSTCFETDRPFSDQVVTQEEKCSAIYASPLVQKKVNFLAERNDSDIVIEVAEN